MYNLPEEFLTRARAQLGENFDKFILTYSGPSERAIRVNTLKISADEFKKISPFALESVSWEPNGFYVSEEKLGKNAYYHAGLYYPQEPTAMCAVPLLEVESGQRVLDLCAAPGGKTTQIAQAMQGCGILIANEINFSRARILSQNVERSGIGNCAVTCADPNDLTKTFGGYFDRILVDAPCSGEGMFKKEPAAIQNWSVKNVLSCAVRQSEILDCAYKMLAGGGRMVYSTCTFSPEEDEEQIANFLERHPDCSLVKQIKLYPHEVRGEGHFAAAIIKAEGERCDLPRFRGGKSDATAFKIFREFEEKYLKTNFKNLRVIGENIYSLPDELPDFSAQCLRAGVRLGAVSKGRFTPDHSLAMYLKGGDCSSVDLNESAAVSYLEGNTFACESEGWLLVTFKGYALGWCKASGGTAKNHYPKGLRL